MILRRSRARWRGAGWRRSSRAPAIGLAGFSFIELLVVVALVLLLATMYWGPMSTSRRRTQQAACRNNLQKAYLALQIYANDHAGAFPEVAEARSSEEPLSQLVPHYTVDTSVFTCPGSKDAALPAGEPFAKRRISYAYFMGRNTTNASAPLMSDRQVDARAKNAGEPAFSSTGKPPGNNHGKAGGNFLFVDGHVEATPPLLPFSLGVTQGVVLLNPRP
ncbi:MAG TPA: prepilin-type N-terminal cleavage/methylation domain-containing protein [Candidatus Acidoferrum sp.]|nr:prepilin-type N-terminal cleavage/methylation domain-containing protein [Candidatus Acidoferrum sp.]